MKIEIWKIILAEDLKTMKVAMDSSYWKCSSVGPNSPILFFFFFSFFSHSQVGNAPGPRVPPWNLQHPLQVLRTHGNFPHHQPLASTHHSSFLVIRKQWLRHWFLFLRKPGTQDSPVRQIQPQSQVLIGVCMRMCLKESVCVMSCLFLKFFCWSPNSQHPRIWLY